MILVVHVPDILIKVYPTPPGVRNHHTQISRNPRHAKVTNINAIYMLIEHRKVV
jgi:hypothetical protein